MNIILFDNHVRNHLLPFTFTRPLAEIRIGISTIREKWERTFKKAQCSYFTLDYLSELFPCMLTDDNFFIAGNLLPNQHLKNILSYTEKGQGYKDPQNRVLALRAGSFEEFTDMSNFKLYNYTDCPAYHSKHDIFRLNNDELINDFKEITKNRNSAILDCSNTLIGNPKSIFIEKGTKIEGTIINCDTGPVYIGKNVQIMEGSCIRGPVAILEGSVVKMGTKIYGATTIGPYCKVGGEINNVVMFGYSNKAHDGYLGNAVIGEWCNIGAGSNASNLKNNYGEVAQWNYASQSYENTGLQFCGLMMGDHSKCSINSMFNTGTVIGVGCNLFGSSFHRSFVPSFSTGNREKGYSSYSIEKVLESEREMFLRREVEMGKAYAKMLGFLHTDDTDY